MTSGFTKIPNRVIQSGKRLTDEEFRLYCTLLSHDFQKGMVYPGRKKLAKEMGASIAKIDRVKRNLESKGAFKKVRRGQGETNQYFINDEFFSEADNSRVSGLVESSVSGKEDIYKKTNYNYLEKSLSYKETNLGENPNGGTKTQPKRKTPTDVIYLSHLNRLKPLVEEELRSLPKPLDEYEISGNIDAAIEGIIYYIRKYKVFCGVDHPLYKRAQLRDCLLGFLYEIWEIETENFTVDEAVVAVIDRWFATTKNESNNLRLSHFAGRDNLIFFNCFYAVKVDYYATQGRSENADS